MVFECQKCGQCCKNIGKTGLLKDFENEKGECIHLTKDNLCSIYDQRPDICNVEKMYKLYFMSLEEYIEYNKAICKVLNQNI